MSEESGVQGVEQECLDTLMLITFFNILHKHLVHSEKKGRISKEENIKRDKRRGNFSARLSTPI